MTFRVGQKVVCIRADSDGWLTKNAVYTISGGGLFGGKFFVDLVEVPTAIRHAWCPTRFRPVVERKTDISFAHEILRRATKPAPALTQSLHHF